MIVAVTDFRDADGNLILEAGQPIPDEWAVYLSPEGIAHDEIEAHEKLKEIARLRLVASLAAKDQKKYHALLYDYHRSLSLAHEVMWRLKAKEKPDG